MFPYTIKDTEIASSIQNNNLLYKIHPKYQNTFEHGHLFEMFETYRKTSQQLEIYQFYFVIYIYIYIYKNAIIHML